MLIDKDITDENFIFIRDLVFMSSSLAAIIVVGYSINGRNIRKNKY